MEKEAASRKTKKIHQSLNPTALNQRKKLQVKKHKKSIKA